MSLPDLKLVRVKNNGLYSGEESKIVAAVRGAADAYIKNYYIKPADRETLKKELQEYYVNTANPVPQEALFDVLEELSGRRYSFNTRHYHLNGVMKNISISGDRASVAASFGSCEDSVGSGWGFGSAVNTHRILEDLAKIKEALNIERSEIKTIEKPGAKKDDDN